LRGVGVAASELGLHDRALIHFEEASKLFTEIRNPFGIASTRIGIARTYFKMGRQDEARQLFERAILDMEQAHKKTPWTAMPVEFGSIELLQVELQAMSASRKN
jgi:tetratricopeptide (TPR) repeat protein